MLKGYCKSDKVWDIICSVADLKIKDPMERILKLDGEAQGLRKEGLGDEADELDFFTRWLGDKLFPNPKICHCCRQKI